MTMKFARHETFPFREGWIPKAFRFLHRENIHDLFYRADAMEILGMGTNMVKALRYWLVALDLVEERKGKERGQWLTPFGAELQKSDSYFEEEVTLWLLHYQLVCSQEKATTWYWFFNFYGLREFDETIFLEELKRWIEEEIKLGEEAPAAGSLKRDYDCLLSMYAVRDGRVIDPEDHLGCPLQELRLIEPVDQKKKTYRIASIDLQHFSLPLAFYMLRHYMDRTGETSGMIRIDTLLTAPTGLGRVLCLSLGGLLELLERMQEEGYVKLTRTAGLNEVQIIDGRTTEELLQSVYSSADVEGVA